MHNSGMPSPSTNTFPSVEPCDCFILHLCCAAVIIWVSAAAAAAAAAAKSLQCDSIDRSPPGSSVPGILQTRTLEWVAISFSNAWKWKVKVKALQSCLTPCDPIDGSPPGSPIHGIFQARVLEWGAIAFSEMLLGGCKVIAVFALLKFAFDTGIHSYG